jgi:DNA-binding HxlR family transcriptional regulator
MEASSRTAYSPSCSCCELLAHKWTPQIIAVLLAGPHRFTAIQAEIPALSGKTLSSRLAWLEEVGIVSRTQFPEIPPRVEYELTPPGRRLEAVIAAMDEWSRDMRRRAPLTGHRVARRLIRSD